MALGARQQVKISKSGQLSRHYIAEISLNVTLNHNKIKPNQTKPCQTIQTFARQRVSHQNILTNVIKIVLMIWFVHAKFCKQLNIFYLH